MYYHSLNTIDPSTCKPAYQDVRLFCLKRFFYHVYHVACIIYTADMVRTFTHAGPRNQDLLDL